MFSAYITISHIMRNYQLIGTPFQPLRWSLRCVLSRLGKIRDPKFLVTLLSSPTVDHFDRLRVHKQATERILYQPRNPPMRRL